ncbi:MAG: OmpA family protein, partial [Cytophagaceae bacterium]|nr:OmpA family protein [Cytophagaceae bacterium]
EAKEIPAPVNSGCECSPKILADNQTMIFASTRAGGKGGLDYYRTQVKDDGTWSTPVAMAFVNTDKDDQYFSITAQGDYVYHTATAKASTDIFKTILPAEFKPKKIMSIEGTVKDGTSQAALVSAVTVYDTKKNKILISTKTDAAGKYYVFLPEGTEYDFSVISGLKNYHFYSEFYDLDTLTKYKEIKNDIKLSVLSKTTKLNLKNIAFEDGNDKILQRSNLEIGRIQKLLADNPTLQIEISAHTDKVLMDSVPAAGLTEIKIDSISVPDPSDSTGVLQIKIAKKTYHNDLTQKRADAIVSALVKKGVPQARVVARGYGDSKPLANTTEQNKIQNRRVELSVLKP